MEFITAAILSGITYDILKSQACITATSLKEKLKGWIVDETIATKLESQLQTLELTTDMSESAIERKINESASILELLKEIKASNTTIIQHHSGKGDNVGRDKIVS